MRPRGQVEVGAHPLRIDAESGEHLVRLARHEIREQERVREGDPLHARVADVPLVPERHVLERRPARSPRSSAREPADPLAAGPGSACAASRRSPSDLRGTAPRPRAPRCAGGAGSRARSSRASAPRSASVDSSSACRSRWTTCVADGLGRRARATASTRSSSSGLRCATVPTAPESFPTATTARRGAKPRRSRGPAPRTRRAL